MRRSRFARCLFPTDREEVALLIRLARTSRDLERLKGNHDKARNYQIEAMQQSDLFHFGEGLYP